VPMSGVLELRLGVTRGALAPRAYTAAVNEITLSLEELDRVVEPDPKSRVAWFVERTDWYESGPTIQLRPDLQGARRSTEDVYRPGRALLAGITSLHTSPKIPDDFTERTVKRMAEVGALTLRHASGIQTIEVAELDRDNTSTQIDERVDNNAKLAVAQASLAYGSVVGKLDVISARTARTRIGLVTDYGPPVTCMVDKIDPEVYLHLFNSKVLVSGILKRNVSGQIIRIEADSLELQQAPSSVDVEALRGALPNPSGMSVAEYLEQQRGR
jgi:hypothetical protein